jgi:sec-independent protein translocase protein TatA
MPNIGAPEVIIIAIVILFLFGGKKLPEFIKGIGQAIAEFKKALKEKN